MVNLRYHIVSITAVFLALGIGLTLGSTFLERVTVDTLKNQLDTVQKAVDDTDAANEELLNRVDALEQRDIELAEELPERLLGGHLDAVPVLVVAAQGTDEALVDRVVDALAASGAPVSGTWWLSDRWSLDDTGEVTDLAGALGLSTQDVDRLRRNAAVRLAELLDTASQARAEPEPPVAPAAPVDPAAPTTVPAEATPTPPAELPLVSALQQAGFLEYDALAGAADDRVLLPGADVRYVVVSDAAPDAGATVFMASLFDELVADGGIAPAVAAQGEVEIRDAKGKLAPEGERRTTFVGRLREGELTRDRVSTVDDLDTAAGLAAMVLALEDLGAQRTGHYGVAPGAGRLLPGSDPET